MVFRLWWLMDTMSLLFYFDNKHNILNIKEGVMMLTTGCNGEILIGRKMDLIKAVVQYYLISQNNHQISK